jgi:O-antigen/teichoic acid export membrane protein
MIIFLAVPNILSKGDYAQLIFISVLLSFMVLSDFGMSFVYSRKMPSVYHKNDLKEIEIYNQTFFWFRITMSIFGSIIISVIYFIKYGVLINSILLLFLNPFTILITFFIVQYSVQEDFKVYKDINIRNSLLKVFIVPFSYVAGLSGWIFGQIIASLIIIRYIKKDVFFKFSNFNFSLIQKHFFEGLILLINFFFWNQLLNSGRLFATMSFEDSEIAQYGLTNAGYSLLLTLSISIFLPVTVASLKIMQTETTKAIEQLFNVILKTTLLISLTTIIAIEVAPYLFKIFFPKYSIDLEILKYQLLSLMALPLVATLGNIFIGLKEPVKLIFINASSFVLSYMVFMNFKEKIVSAAIAQCIGVTFLGLCLLFSVMIFYGKFIENKFQKIIIILCVIFLPYIIYFNIRALF